jgi:pimeloyl-ACP methyl ester carboxylesterase
VEEDGGVGLAGSQCPGAGCENHQVTVTTSCIDNIPLAFAVYRAPIDFARTSVDNSLGLYRDVTIHVGSVNGSGDFPVRIVRPPVALIHGLWADWTTWDKFSPLVTGHDHVDQRFSVFRVNYGWNVGLRILCQ